MGSSRRRLLQAALISAALSGCTVGHFDNSDMRSAEVSKPYQEAYRNVLSFAKRCFEAGMITAELKVDGQLFTDIKRGTVDIYLLGYLGRQNHFQVEISEHSPATSTVEVRRGIRPIVNRDAVFESFFDAARGNAPSTCGF